MCALEVTGQLRWYVEVTVTSLTVIVGRARQVVLDERQARSEVDNACGTDVMRLRRAQVLRQRLRGFEALVAACAVSDHVVRMRRIFYVGSFRHDLYAGHIQLSMLTSSVSYGLSTIRTSASESSEGLIDDDTIDTIGSSEPCCRVPRP